MIRWDLALLLAAVVGYTVWSIATMVTNPCPGDCLPRSAVTDAARDYKAAQTSLDQIIRTYQREDRQLLTLLNDLKKVR